MPESPVLTRRRLPGPKNTLGSDARLRVSTCDTHVDTGVWWPGCGLQKRWCGPLRSVWLVTSFGIPPFLLGSLSLPPPPPVFY